MMRDILLRKSWIWVTFLVFNLLQSCHAFFINIEADSSECFFDRVKTGVKVGLTFEVVEGGFMDIDVQISGPDGKVIYSGERESNGKYTFATHMDGAYQYCFSNKMSTLTTKTVMFTLDIGDTPDATKPASPEQQNAEHEKLENMVRDLSSALTTVKHEQDYMNVRARIHSQINESTNSRVVMWAFFEALIIVCMTVGQVYYLKRFFEVRRVV